MPGKTTIELYDLATKKLLVTLDEHRKSVRSLAFSGDGKRLVSGGDDGLVLVWDLTTNKTVHKLVGHTKSVEWPRRLRRRAGGRLGLPRFHGPAVGPGEG